MRAIVSVCRVGIVRIVITEIVLPARVDNQRSVMVMMVTASVQQMSHSVEMRNVVIL